MTKRTTDHLPKAKGPKATYEVPSGMGGSFPVNVTGEFTRDSIEFVSLKVIMRGNPDWHGYEFSMRKDRFENERIAA